MSKIIAFCGKKQSGKSSSAKFICGNEMMRLSIIDNLTVEDSGDIGTTLPDGKQITFDFDNKSLESMSFFSERVWPTVRKFSFADKLKLAVHQIFGISPELMYGTEEQKNSKTHMVLSDLFGLIDVCTINTLRKTMKDNEPLSIRQVLQFFGTNICRKMDDKCWINGLLNDIAEYNSELSIVDDCRFKNEVFALKEAGAILIKLNKFHGEDSHKSEKDLDDIDESVFDLVVDNSQMSLLDKNELIMNWLQTNQIISKNYKDSGITRAKLV